MFFLQLKDHHTPALPSLLVEGDGCMLEITETGKEEQGQESMLTKTSLRGRGLTYPAQGH